MNVNSVMQRCVEITVGDASKMLGIVNHFAYVAMFAYMGVCISVFTVCAYVQESSLLVLQASLKGELEANQQQLESSKVTQPTLLSKPSPSDPF